MILVDSSVWIDYFRGTLTPQTSRLDDLLNSELLAIGDLILLEVLQGFNKQRDFDTAKKMLTELIIIHLAGEAVAIRAAVNARLLRARGITVRKTIDALIATRCIESGYELLHNDRDFTPFVKYLGLREVM